MTQRLGLARVLLHDPQVLLLDEPASGLDPRARIEMRALLTQLRSMGKTIMISSHILPELADICNKIGIIERGQLIFNGTVESAIRQVRKNTVYLIAVANDLNGKARDQIEGHVDVMKVDEKEVQNCLRVTLADGLTDASFLVDLLMENGLRMKTFKEEEINLENVFLDITKGITN